VCTATDGPTVSSTITLSAPSTVALLSGSFGGSVHAGTNDVTLAPAMGQFLDMANNSKANANNTILPNENYAREVIQLFTIGTVLLNPDGSKQLDSSNNPIATYDQSTVANFAKVYTGWTYAPAAGGNIVWGAYINPSAPMVPYPPMHDTTAKTLLQYSAPAGVFTSLPAGQSAQTDLAEALDNIFYHPNVGPFISKQLIQHLVKSNPTPAYVQRVAAAYLKPSNRTMGEFIPEAKPDRVEVSAKTDVAALVKDYKGDAALAAGEAFDPSVDNIESRTTRFTLPSGMKVALLPKKTRGASVHANISLHFGDLDNLKGKETAAGLAGQILMKGTDKHNRQQIQDEIDRLQAQLSVFGSATGAGAGMETNRENLPAVLRLAAEILKEATLPETEFEQARKRVTTQLEAGKAEPQVQAFTALNRTLYPFPKGDVRATLTTDEEIEEYKNARYADAKAFYSTFYGASHAELAIVGDFDAAEAKKLANELFGTWKSGAKFERIKMGFEKIAPATQSIETPDKANAVFIASERLRLSDQDPDYAALVFGNYMLGGGFLNSRLAQRIRVKDGLSYGISSSLSAKSNEEDGRFQAMAIAAPQNVAKVETAFREEIARVLKDGFEDKEVEADKAGWLQSRQMGRAEDGSLCGMLAGRDHDERTLVWDKDLEAKVKSLTAAQVTEALRRHLDPAQITIVKAGDFQKAAAAGK